MMAHSGRGESRKPPPRGHVLNLGPLKQFDRDRRLAGQVVTRAKPDAAELIAFIECQPSGGIEPIRLMQSFVF
jgi:hypothetical protein